MKTINLHQLKVADFFYDQLKVAARVDPPWADGADPPRGHSIRSQGRDGENLLKLLL